MSDYRLEISTYRLNKNRKCIRLCVMGKLGGTRIYGNKFSECPSEETFNIPLTETVLNDLIKELEIIKKKVGNK